MLFIISITEIYEWHADSIETTSVYLKIIQIFSNTVNFMF